MGVCYLRFEFHVCFPALLTVVGLTAITLATPVRTLLTRVGIEATADKANTPEAARRKVTGLGPTRTLAIVLVHTL